jgi:phosphatidylserine/phosphatidylglycerophosphate/cardiolipin synthase-like enzyme
VIQPPKFADALVAKASEGVEVNVLLDALVPPR